METGYEGIEPKLFEAAFNNDVGFMHYCLDAGKSFNDSDGFCGFTPMHVAAIYKSHDFIREAIKTKQPNLWIRDDCLRLPFDISSAFKDYDAMNLMFDWMHEGPFGPKPDAEVSEFPSQGL